MFFVVLFETIIYDREQLDKVLKKSFVNFYFWGITLSFDVVSGCYTVEPRHNDVPRDGYNIITSLYRGIVTSINKSHI